MKEIIPDIKDIVIIAILAIISLFLGALFLKVEELKQHIPETTHAMLDNSIRESIRLWFKEQEDKGNVFTFPVYFPY